MPTLLIALVLCCFSFSSGALAKDYYISTTGRDTNGCTNQTTDACATFPRCVQVMSAGDTCYALGGTYTISGINGWRIMGSGGTATARKTLRGMPGQTATFRPTSYANSEQEATITLGDAALDYLIISDITLYGRLRAAEALSDSADYVTLERIAFRCPGAGGTGNTASIMTISQQDANGWTAREGWVVRDNLFVIDSSCPDYCPVAPDGISFIHFYSMSRAVIESNDFRLEDPSRSCMSPKMRFGLWFKGRAEYSRVRFNYCTGDIGACISFNTGKCPAGFESTCDPTFLPYSAGDNRAYQNISSRSGSIGWDSNNFFDSDMVYNNTIYRPLYDGITASPSTGPTRSRANSSIFNNIILSKSSDLLGGYYGYLRWASTTDADGICTQAYIDHNVYYPVDPMKRANFTANRHFSSTLEEWRSLLGTSCANEQVRENHSRVLDPLFVNPEAGDFHLATTSPARTGGRGGSWPIVAGAYVDGTEVIGCRFDPRCSANGAPDPPPQIAPAKVQGVCRTDSR
jgi:hypothetical protein